MTPDLIKAVLAGLLRHGLTILGTFLVAKGYLTPEDQTTFANDVIEWLGSAVVVGSMGWQVYQKYVAHKTLAVAKASPAEPSGGV